MVKDNVIVPNKNLSQIAFYKNFYWLELCDKKYIRLVSVIQESLNLKYKIQYPHTMHKQNRNFLLHSNFKVVFSVFIL
jgi:hypothetical protein